MVVSGCQRRDENGKEKSGGWLEGRGEQTVRVGLKAGLGKKKKRRHRESETDAVGEGSVERKKKMRDTVAGQRNKEEGEGEAVMGAVLAGWLEQGGAREGEIVEGLQLWLWGWGQ